MTVRHERGWLSMVFAEDFCQSGPWAVLNPGAPVRVVLNAWSDQTMRWPPDAGTAIDFELMDLEGDP